MAPAVPAKPPHIMIPTAVQILRSGALGVGETHTEPNARLLVKRLFELREVSRFFVEMAPWSAEMLSEVQAKMAAGKTREAQTIARSIAFYESKENAYPRLGDLIYLAIAWKVEVILADPLINLSPSMGNVYRRNVKTAEVFKKALGGALANSAKAKGSLLLFGSDHFQGHKSLQNLLPGLRWITMSGRAAT